MKLTIKHPADFSAYMAELLKHPANRRAYYASRAWQMRKRALALRSNGKCERCKNGRYQITHHLTYAHFGGEFLNELQAICRDCHRYLHGHSDYDPASTTGLPVQQSLF